MPTVLSVVSQPTAVLCGATVVLSLLWWWSTRRPRGLPPGPGPAVPLLGHLHLLSKDPRRQFVEWRRKYGDVFSLYMGGRLVVALNGYEVIKEALITHADIFSNRPRSFVTDSISKNKGVLSTNGQVWKEQRKVTLEILREFGMGKNVLAEKIQDEVQEFIKVVASHQGQAFNLGELIYASISNNICSVVIGQKFDYKDPLFLRYIEMMNQNLQAIGNTAVLMFFPSLKYLPGDMFKFKRTLSNVAFVENSLVKPQLENHLKTYTEGSEPSDFIHAYIREIRKKEAEGKVTTINEDYLFKVIGDLLVAGTESTSTTIRWGLLYFLHYPDVQDKCFEEINRVIGTHRPPSMRDKQDLIYFEATLMEILRYSNIGPLGVQHGLAHETVFRGYRIPQDAIVLPTMISLHYDEKIWGDPFNFRPERFIGPEGKLTKPEEFIPFGIGRRVCIGEAMARTELFLYLATLLQHFRFLPPEDDQLPSLEGILGMVYTPKPYTIRAVPRN